MSKRTPPKKISGGDNPYDVHDAKLSSSMTAHEISNTISYKRTALFLIFLKLFLKFVVFILTNLLLIEYLFCHKSNHKFSRTSYVEIAVFSPYSLCLGNIFSSASWLIANSLFSLSLIPPLQIGAYKNHRFHSLRLLL